MRTGILSAFLRRDRLLSISYRLEFALNGLSVILTVATFYYVARIFGPSASPVIARYGGDYFPYVLVGIAFSSYQRLGLQACAQKLREEQTQGTLEQILITPLAPFSFLLGSVQWDAVITTLEVMLYFAAARFIFGAAFPHAHLPAAAGVLFLTLAAFFGLGMLSAAFVLKFKKGDPAAWLFAALSDLFGGVFFPPELLPPWLQPVSRLLPMTHSLDGLRKSLIQGADWSELTPSLFALAGFAAFLIPAGLWAFRWALASARRDGTLGHS